MNYRNLGRSGLKVSRLCLGTMMFGGRTPADEAERILDIARTAEINFLDTADVYVHGECERLVGRLIARDRERWVLATKVGQKMGRRHYEQGLNRRWLMQAIEASLTRLGTDYVDVWYMHVDDEETPIEETVLTLGDIMQQGKVRHIGLSNYRGWRLTEFVNTCKRLNVSPPIVCQPYYNAMNRQPEVEVIPACAYHGLGVVPYSPLARGVLTGKYAPSAEPEGDTRAGRRDARMMESEWRPESLEMAQKIKAHAEARGMTAGQFALNWVLANPYVVSAIAGPRTVEQMEDYVRALDKDFGPEDEALIDSLVAPGHPSTPGYNDPKYPITGRTRAVV
jgi:aryl-alcohol dehydrogenase-like predicted oxidoreductase